MQSRRAEKKREAHRDDPAVNTPSFSASSGPNSGPANENILLLSGLALLILSASMVISAFVG
jgi:hypothetical protein